MKTIGTKLGVSGIAVVSAHWQTSDVRATTSLLPETIHDFGGFPPELYRLQYPAPGAPELAAEAARLLRTAEFVASGDGQRGLDHGVWVPLMHLFPRADVPVIQISMPYDLDTAGAWRLGRALAPLRDRGVLVIGSGSLTHNLYEVRHKGLADEPYASEFSRWVREAVLEGDTDRLIRYRRSAPHAERAHPTEEHYLPLLVAMGANAVAHDAAHVIEGGMTYGVLSMESYFWGSIG